MVEGKSRVVIVTEPIRSCCEEMRFEQISPTACACTCVFVTLCLWLCECQILWLELKMRVLARFHCGKTEKRRKSEAQRQSLHSSLPPPWPALTNLEVKQVWHAEVQKTHDDREGGQEGVKKMGKVRERRAPPGWHAHTQWDAQRRAPPYLRGDPMREVGGVGLLPALWRRRTACRRNVLRSRRKMTVSSLPGAVVARDITGQVSLPSTGWFFLSWGHLHEVILTQHVSRENIGSQKVAFWWRCSLFQWGPQTRPVWSGFEMR